MLYTVDTNKSLEQIREEFGEVAKKHSFGVLAIHDLQEKMHEKGVEFTRGCLIFEVCNPQKAKSVLERDMAVSTSLPCRVSAYEEEGKVRIATLRPTMLMKAYGDLGLEGVASEVEATLIAIMNEVAGS